MVERVSYEDELKGILEEVASYNKNADKALIAKAFNFAKSSHDGQKRESGANFFLHPIAVAKIIISLKADSPCIAATFLHDVVEDTPVTLEQVKKEFGDEVADLVEGVTKIDKIHFPSKEEYNAENLRKIVLATVKDVRIILIKLADRLHNMKTLKHFPVEKQKRIAQQTKEIYVPLAHKLGVYKIKGELEDLCLRYLEPKVYKLLAKSIAQKRTEREKIAQDLIMMIKCSLKEKGVDAEVYGRAKYFHSIYKKMKKKNIDFDEVYDLIAVRIVTKMIPDCYAALGVVHDLWKPIPRRFKDYISLPKSNGYQSLHTTLVTDRQKILEVQIRTEKMHHLAEEGVAAHWRYQGTERDKDFDQRISWLKQILDWKQHSADASDFVETLKVDLFQDEIVVFTPKGDPIPLPKGSSPVDFAYAVHSTVGDTCSKAKVNNKIVPLSSELISGTIVEIVTQKNAKPNRNWLSFVKTTKAKTKIRHALNIVAEHDPKKGRKKKEEIIVKGKVLVETGVKGTVKISKCCSPVQNDAISAYLMKDKTITVHKKNCPNIHSLSSMKPVKVFWQKKKQYTTIMVPVSDTVGVLAALLHIIARRKFNLFTVSTKRKKDHVVNKLVVESTDEDQLSALVKELKLVEGVIDAKIAD